MIRLSTLLAICLLCLNALALYAAPNSRANHEDDIREAALRFQLHPYALPTDTKPKKNVKPPSPRAPKDSDNPFKVYFFSIGNNKDPSDKLLKRFAGHKPPIKKVSQCYIKSKPDTTGTFSDRLWVRDKRTQEIGIIYTISGIRWLGKNKVRVESHSLAGGLFAGSSTYTLRRKGKTWRVTYVKLGPVA